VRSRAQGLAIDAMRDLRPFSCVPPSTQTDMDPVTGSGARGEPKEVEMFTVRVRDVMTAPEIAVGHCAV
jgi:hypothetical protein